jgi:hypothetical protein
MDGIENVFDNSISAPAIEGQVDVVAEDNTENNTSPEVQTEGQEVITNEPDYRKLYQETKQAYDNLRPVYTKATQELSKYKQTNPEQPVKQAQGDPNDISSIVSGLVQQAVAPLQQQQAELMLQNEVSRLRNTLPDFDTYAPKMYDLLESNPNLWNIGDTNAVLETAYKLTKIEDLEKQIPDIVSKAQNDIYASKVTKEINSTDRTRANQNGAEKSQGDMIRDGILSDSIKKQGSIF